MLGFFGIGRGLPCMGALYLEETGIGLSLGLGRSEEEGGGRDDGGCDSMRTR